MKQLAFVLTAVVVATAITGCDSSTNSKTTTKIDTLKVYDTTYYNDRFALNMPVVDGHWKVYRTGDTADGFFYQDSNKVSAYIVWSKSDTTWVLTGGAVDNSGILFVTNTTASYTRFTGSFTDSAHHVKTAMSGSFRVSSNTTSDPDKLFAWTAKRIE
jgi:membrane-bound inhibitor of C-type lysozyme